MNRIILAIKILLGYNIVVYNYWRDNELVMTIGGREDILENGYNYKLIHELDLFLEEKE